MYLCIYVSMVVCMYVCIYLSIYVSMYLCIYVSLACRCFFNSVELAPLFGISNYDSNTAELRPKWNRIDRCDPIG